MCSAMSTTTTMTAPPAPRPRLVAKSASGHQASAPKSANSGFRNGGSGPDPMQVWNKNRGMPCQCKAPGTYNINAFSAAPQAPQKHFTDEELKQQYGIHLATRLQADADGKEAKWADIDDDEDDWAPDTIEWNDGTKITLSHNDPAAALVEEQAAAAAEKARQEERNRARMPPPKPTTSVGPNAKVLKLGASGPPKQDGAGSAFKISSDKPTLVAKPTPPAPVKSPWASLPPVDKVAPVAINPPLQSSTPRFHQSDSQITESVPAPLPPAPAMEIAADSFTRTPRENQGGSQGQLYNSQSGQYEPVISGRRGSMRKDQNFRPPAVLQRPSQTEQRPAEPSAAFQTQRSGSQQEANRWERRTSSTVSGGSGFQVRRVSLSKGVGENNQQHAESQPLESPRTPGLANAQTTQDSHLQSKSLQTFHSPALAKLQQLHDIGSHPQSPQQGQSPLVDAATTSQMSADLNADTERQKKLMKEKRELAIKRKKEEEEREEVAKRERIRIKLEQLGMAPLEKQELEKKPNEIKQVVKREANQEVTHKASQENIAGPPQSPPKPPLPDASSGTRQYGMMKLHGPSPINGITPNTDQSTVEAQTSTVPPQRTSPPKTESSLRLDERIPSPMTNGDIHKSFKRSSVPASPEARDQHIMQPPRQRPWNNVPRDPNTFTAWNGSGMTTHTAPSGSLWGPPSNHKALGNGVFDGNVPRPPSRHTPYQEHQPQPTPQPIGPPRSSQRPRESAESNRPSHNRASPLTEDFQTMPPYPSQDRSAAPPSTGESKSHGQRPFASSEAAVSMPPKPPISPESLPVDDGQRRSSLAAWGNFQGTSAKEEAEQRRLATQQHAARLAEEARTGIRHEPQLPVLNETWRQVKVDDQAGQRRVVAVAKDANVPDGPVAHQVTGDLRMPPFANPSHLAHPAGPSRGSRFFPTGGQGYQNQQRAASYTMGYNRSPSPPPPDSMQHPAYIRSQQHPLVNLPVMKPKPTVRLPPALATAPPTPLLADVRAAPLRAVSQPLVQNPSWQDRFNGLLGVKKQIVSPEKKFADVAGFSETKVPFELLPVQVSAAVSLPSRDADVTKAGIGGTAISKSVEEEEALFEEREFGSLPTVLLPVIPPKLKSQKNRKGLPKHPKEPRPVSDVTSKEMLELRLEDKENDDPNGFALFINFKGMPFPKKKIMPRPNAPTPPTSHSVRGNRNLSGINKGSRGPKSRGPSSNFGNQKPASSGPQRVPTQNLPEPHGKGPWSKSWARVPIAG